MSPVSSSSSPSRCLLERFARFDPPARKAPGGVVASQLQEDPTCCWVANDYAGGDQHVMRD
jgi:hypothetical protein